MTTMMAFGFFRMAGLYVMMFNSSPDIDYHNYEARNWDAVTVQPIW